MVQRIVGIDHSPRHAYQVFQDYYEKVLLKGTSPSTMYVLSILPPPPLVFIFLNGYRLVALGLGPHK